MNGIHDMGGMDGMGPIEPERDEPLFHAPWEARALALSLAMAGWRKWNIDASRHARERIPPADYLRFSYYEKWIAGLCDLMLQHGLVTQAELDSNRPAPGSPRAIPPLDAARVAAVLGKGDPVSREIKAAPRFAPGDEVRARNIHPEGHTRLPRYARGRTGVVLTRHGAHVWPDSNAHFRGEDPQHLYTVRFAARELWGMAAPATDYIHIDLWEPYLERA